MKFRDGVERDPEEYGYQVLLQKHLDEISKKRNEKPDCKKSMELVREVAQVPQAFIYKFKLKDLDIDEGFSRENLDYVCKRIE